MTNTTISIKKKNISHLSIIWRRLSRSKTAIIGLFIVGLYVLTAIFGPYLAPHDPIAQDLSKTFLAPSAQHLMGCDEFGRDIFSRIIHGARVSLIIQFNSVVIALVVGIALGAMGGYFGGLVDEIIMRLMDVMLAFPGMLLALAIVAMLGPNLTNLIVAIGIYSVPQFARVTRGAVISVKKNEYVTAAKAIGESDFSIITRYVLPNAPLSHNSTDHLEDGYGSADRSGAGLFGAGGATSNAGVGDYAQRCEDVPEDSPFRGLLPWLGHNVGCSGIQLLWRRPPGRPEPQT